MTLWRHRQCKAPTIQTMKQMTMLLWSVVSKYVWDVYFQIWYCLFFTDSFLPFQKSFCMISRKQLVQSHLCLVYQTWLVRLTVKQHILVRRYLHHIYILIAFYLLPFFHYTFLFFQMSFSITMPNHLIKAHNKTMTAVKKVSKLISQQHWWEFYLAVFRHQSIYPMCLIKLREESIYF